MLVGYARVSTQEQDLALQLDALQTAGCSKVFEEKASGAQRERPALKAALDYMRDGRHARGVEARSPRPLAQAADRDRRGVRHARHWPALAHRGDRHHHRRRQADLPPLRRPGRVRARRHPRAHPGRPAGGPSTWPHRRQAPCPQGQGPGRGQGPAQGSRDHRARGRQRLGVAASTLYRHLPRARTAALDA